MRESEVNIGFSSDLAARGGKAGAVLGGSSGGVCGVFETGEADPLVVCVVLCGDFSDIGENTDCVVSFFVPDTSLFT